MWKEISMLQSYENSPLLSRSVASPIGRRYSYLTLIRANFPIAFNFFFLYDGQGKHSNPTNAEVSCEFRSYPPSFV